MRPSSRQRAAFTLIELAVYGALLGFLMGGVILLAMSGSRLLRTGSAYQSVQQQALVGMRKLSSELARSTPARRDPTTPANADYIIFLSPEQPLDQPAAPWDHDGNDQLYHKWVCYYHDPGSNELRRSEADTGFAPGGHSSASAPASPGLVAFQAMPFRVVARGISRFEVSEASVPEVLQLAVHAEAATGNSTNTQPRVTRVETRSWVKQENV